MAAKKRKAWRCAGCGGKLGKKATACGRCGTAGGPGALKSSGAMLRFLAKQASPPPVRYQAPAANVVPFVAKAAGAPQRPACIHGCGKSRAGANCCTSCGALLPGRRVQAPVVKSSMDSPDYWTRMMMRSPNPATREEIRAAHLQLPSITKSAAPPGPPADPAPLWRQFYAEADPNRRDVLWRLIHPQTEGGGAA